MKVIFFTIVFTFLGVMASDILYSQDERLTTSETKDYSDSSEKVINVEALMNSTEKYPFPVRVRGAVSLINAKDDILGLIDLDEVEKCGTVSCANLTLPVLWAGIMPSVGDKIVLTGEIEDISGKFIFTATELEHISDNPDPEAGE